MEKITFNEITATRISKEEEFSGLDTYIIDLPKIVLRLNFSVDYDGSIDVSSDYILKDTPEYEKYLKEIEFLKQSI